MTAVLDRIDYRLERFKLFNELGGKFRLGVVNICNLDCFFCHNEAMPNPRRLPKSPNSPLDLEDLLGLVDAWTGLGGRQVNLTGGEPMAWRGLPELLERLEKRESRIMLNTNALLADRLLKVPKFEKLDGMLASLHTTNEDDFERDLGKRGAAKVMRNIVALRDHGYAMSINYSLGPWNRDEFSKVLEYAVGNRVPLKVIALVRPNESDDFYRGDWVDPKFVTERLDDVGARFHSEESSFGGRKKVYYADGVKVQVKNVAEGRLRTDFCKGCAYEAKCGEGIYGLRVGVDGVFKPCLLRRDKFKNVDRRLTYREQVLDHIAAMVGDWDNIRFATGSPE